MSEREDKLRRWFAMWLNQTDAGIESLFAPDAVYIESWGPEYHGLPAIRHWFSEWNSRGRVVAWDIKQLFHKDNQTVVEWYLRDAMEDGRVEEFDGLSLVVWNGAGQIVRLQEFGCNLNRYDPYANDPIPQFRDEKAAWF